MSSINKQRLYYDQKDPYMHRMMAAIGIKKGSTFKLDATQQQLLNYAAMTAWKMAKNIAANYDKDLNALWWKDREWVANGKTSFDDFRYIFLNEGFADKKTNYTDVNAKAYICS